MRKVLFVMLMVIAFALLGTAANAQSRCSGSQLSVAEGEGDADMGGKRYGVFEFTNISSKPCKMSGYPKFAALNRAGKILTTVPVKYSNDFPNSMLDKTAHRNVIDLEPGKKAQFQIYYNDGMALETKKPFPKVSKVRITAPGDKKAFLLNSVFTSCCGINVGSVSVVQSP